MGTKWMPTFQFISLVTGGENHDKVQIRFFGCSNEIMYVRTRIIIKTDVDENYVNFRRYGTTDDPNKN